MKVEKHQGRSLEPEIKSAILNHLKGREGFPKESIIINEFSLDSHVRRVDLAYFDSKNFYAFEVKSGADSLSRLSGQIEEYLNYFDKVVVVADAKHIDRVVKIAPTHVGVWEFGDGRIKVVRRGRIARTSKYQLLKLLKVSEINWILKKYAALHRLPKSKAINLAASKISISVTRELVFSLLGRRFYSTSEKFIGETKDRVIKASDIDLLSPYAVLRRARKQRSQSELELLQELKRLQDFL